MDSAPSDVLVFGATSLVGSHFVNATAHGIVAAGRTDPRPSSPRVRQFTSLDLLDLPAVQHLVKAAPEACVVSFAAATAVDRVERERSTRMGGAGRGEAWRLNAELPSALAEACATSGKYLVTFSTDFVFDGRDGPYRENDVPASSPDAVSWYGWTKREGERRVLDALPAAAIVRISYPFGPSNARKLDLARWIVDRSRSHTLPPLYADQRIAPTWIPDVARVLDHLLASRPPGLFHVASPTTTSPLEFGRTLLDLVEPSHPPLASGSLAEALAVPGATPRPLRGGLLDTRLRERGISLTPWDRAVRTFAEEGVGR